ncbi:hypothetical protein HK098_005270 [Nowakowskiella sp. JEL0407]|nr:hypothetical protein HK098_005270 [Nowakowskiella sp. JEL0407]
MTVAVSIKFAISNNSAHFVFSHDVAVGYSAVDSLYLVSLAGFKGTWYSHNQTSVLSNHSIAYNETVAKSALSDFEYDRGAGTLMLDLYLNETLISDVQFAEGYVRFISDRWHGFSGEQLVHLKGLYFAKNGSLWTFGMTDGNSYSLKEIPLLMRTNETFHLAKSVVMGRNDEDIESLEKRLKNSASERRENNYITPRNQCQFALFLQTHAAPSSYSEVDVLLLEKELQNPQGIWTKRPPALYGDIQIYSPNCNLFIKSKKITGIKIEKVHNKRINYTIFAGFIILSEIFLTARQVQHTLTQSALSKVSLLCICTQALNDAYLFLVNILMALSIPKLFIPFIALSFFKFILFSTLEMRYILSILRAQRRDLDESSINSLYSRFYMFAFFGLFFVYNLTIRYSLLLAIFGFAIHSYWIPQIISNIQTNTRTAFSKNYVFGMSILRLSVPVYLYACPESIVAYHQTHPHTILALCVYVAIQVAILTCQEYFGPRMFIPESVLPSRYNYHPIVKPSRDEESGESKEDNPIARLKNHDCAICFGPVNFSDSLSMAKSRVNYMITPCEHLFHTACLEKWMEIKLECPVCRTELPPL